MSRITYRIVAETETLDGSKLTYGRCFIYRNDMCVGTACGASKAHAVRRAHADVRRLRKGAQLNKVAVPYR